MLNVRARRIVEEEVIEEEKFCDPCRRMCEEPSADVVEKLLEGTPFDCFDSIEPEIEEEMSKMYSRELGDVLEKLVEMLSCKEKSVK